MQFLNTHEWKMAAAACLVVCVFLIIRAFTINANTGKRRFGKKSFVFLFCTLALVAAIRLANEYVIQETYESVARANAAVLVQDSTYRTASVNVQTAFEDFSAAFQTLPTGGEAKSELAALGQLAGKTRRLGEAVIVKFEVLEAAAADYQASLSAAGNTYRAARKNLNNLATDERSLLLQSSKIIKGMADEEDYEELGVAYVELAEVFRKLSRMTESRYTEIDVNLPALESAIQYVRRANQYLKTVETHASTLAEFQSPTSILEDIKVYQDGVKKVTDGIKDLNQRLDELSSSTI